MARRGEKSFGRLVGEHENLIVKRPIGRAALLSSLSSVWQAGKRELAMDLGSGEFAGSMTQLYAGALALDTDGHIQPPLDPNQRADFEGRLDTLKVFDIGNTGGQGGPTNPSDIPTGDRK